MDKIVDFTMPKLGEVMEEGTILGWRRSIGETIVKDEILVEIETDKAISEIPSPVSGTVVEIVVTEGSTVPIKTVLARISLAQHK